MISTPEVHNAINMNAISSHTYQEHLVPSQTLSNTHDSAGRDALPTT